MNVFVYASVEERYFEYMLSSVTSYQRQTTFYSDLSIAEFYGINSVKETFESVKKSWLKDVKYWTEFVICLNYKSWEFADRTKTSIGNHVLSEEERGAFINLYVELYEKARDLAYETFDKEGQRYFFEVTD